MQHRGEIVEKAIRESGFSITKLAIRLGKSRRTMYHIFENPTLSFEVISEIGAIINYDFTVHFKKMNPYYMGSGKQNLHESIKRYNDQNSEIELWKNKYLDLLEKYNELLLKNSGAGSKEKKYKSAPRKKK